MDKCEYTEHKDCKHYDVIEGEYGDCYLHWPMYEPDTCKRQNCLYKKGLKKGTDEMRSKIVAKLVLYIEEHEAVVAKYPLCEDAYMHRIQALLLFMAKINQTKSRDSC